ncbi:hydantoinase B/oxoprolinase family protein [Pararhizobium sp. LjRoot255]|uniref:hydantoinase B/oxoprolinase family protein n=1 Tax=Pararhizobium sp. LjRoot255 TaxID=3342298 RepID=UPI003ECCA858
MDTPSQTNFDPFLTAIIANRIEGIIREMTNTMLRSARSAVISSARDFSCSIVTADDKLLATAEGLPIHIFGSDLLTSAMTACHGGDILEGDCYLHNDPYTGNSHAADHAFLVPVFIEGEHMFTAVAKAHQADIGNSLPTTYMAGARDQYAEGALIFPAVRVQRNYKTNDDIIRMCRSRIRVPNQWYGDFLAGIGSARIAERRLKELCDKYGKEQIRAFVKGWFDYSEDLMVKALKQMPRTRLSNSGRHDALPGLLPDGVRLNVSLEIDPEEAMIDIDLRDNVDSLPVGLNLSLASASAAAVSGVFNSMSIAVPRNYGSFQRIRLHFREGSILGKPRFPHSCSVGTTNIADRVINIVQAAFAGVSDGWGLAEGGVGVGIGFAVVSGSDHRYGSSAYVNQICLGSAGGPGSPEADGWPTYGIPVVAGLMYRDSIEIDELKHPFEVQYCRLKPATGGAGEFRGGAALEMSITPKENPIDFIWNCDGQETAPKGVRGGKDGVVAQHWMVAADGRSEQLPSIVHKTLHKDERLYGWHTSGGGYGDPYKRDTSLVLEDVLEGYETVERARDVYGVALTGSVRDETIAIDHAATSALRRAN